MVELNKLILKVSDYMLEIVKDFVSRNNHKVVRSIMDLKV